MNIRVAFYFYLFFSFLVVKGFGQDSYRIGTLPSVNLNKTLSDEWKVNANWQSRQVYKTGTFQESSESKFDYVLNDFTFLGSKNVGLNNSFAAGFLIRVEGDQIIYRTIQQFAVVKRYSSFRLAHRLSTDQTFEENEKTEFRFRYRLTGEIPLNGQSVDQGEFYLKVNHEYLNSLQGDEYDMEIRLIPFIGYSLNAKNKFELGLDYRINSFIDNESSSSFWLAINWYYKL